MNIHNSMLMAVQFDAQSLLGASAYALLGLVMFSLFWFVLVKVSPFSIRKEIEEDQNVALGVIIGCVVLGMAIIIAAAIAG